MSTRFIDPAAPRYHGPLPPPRGLLPLPAEFKEQVAKDQARLQPYYTNEYAKLVLDDWTLAYYYEGINVAYRSVPEGVEVLAVGDEEIGRFLREAPPEQHRNVKTKIP